jgi:hypothetical protein
MQKCSICEYNFWGAQCVFTLKLASYIIGKEGNLSQTIFVGFVCIVPKSHAKVKTWNEFNN